METEKTIAELWNRFNSIKNLFGFDRDYSKLIDLSRYENPAPERISWVQEITSLRQQLLERCSELIDCTNGHFSINQKLILRISHGEINAFKEGAAILSFWAWELEQMKGKQNGN